MIHRLANLNSLIKDSDIGCINELRMNMSTFNVLCEMLRDIGDSRETKKMSLNETVAIFLYILAHHKKNRTIGNYFVRSGETISRQFNRCLLCSFTLKILSVLLFQLVQKCVLVATLLCPILFGD